MQLFRPFVTRRDPSTPHSRFLAGINFSNEPAIYALNSASQQLRQLLAHGSTMFAGLQAPVIFSQVAVVVALDTLPSASALSKSYSPSAGTTFVNALHVLYGMGRVFFALRVALLGIRQTALRMHLPIPAEAEDIFAQVHSDISGTVTTSSLKANWIVGLETAEENVQAARLQNLIKELENLDLAPRNELVRDLSIVLHSEK